MATEICAICGQEVEATAGHFATVIKATGTGSEGGGVENVTEFHCFGCDPIDPDYQPPVIETQQGNN